MCEHAASIHIHTCVLNLYLCFELPADSLSRRMNIMTGIIFLCIAVYATVTLVFSVYLKTGFLLYCVEQCLVNKICLAD